MLGSNPITADELAARVERNGDLVRFDIDSLRHIISCLREHEERAAHIECRDEFRQLTPKGEEFNRHPTKDDRTASSCDEGSRPVSSRKPALVESSAASQCDHVEKPPFNTPQIGDGRPGSAGAVADRAESGDWNGK